MLFRVMSAANQKTLSTSIDALERIREDLLRLQTDLETLEGLRPGAAEENENAEAG